jgi:flagellar basal-body rod protein FlgF
MDTGLYRSAASLHTRQQQLDSIARNLANLSTVGYKRGASATFELSDRGGERRSIATETEVDFSQGSLRRTGRNLDVALLGEGFFGAESPRGEVYTRDGSFRLSPEGVLLTGDGFPVAWTTLNRQIDPAGLPVTIDGDGTARQGFEEIGRLKVVNFEDPQRLTLGEHGYWNAPADLPEATATAVVNQGALEESNATGMEEMVSMINVQRQFDTVARAMKSIQDSYRRLTRPM